MKIYSALMMNAQKIKNAANKALIAANSRYHSWTPEKQEKFRATMSNAALNRVDIVLLKEIFGIQCAVKNGDEIRNNLPSSKLNKLNWAKLFIQGVGDDMVYLNEYMGDNTLLDFNTLHDYDYDNYLFQEEANKERFTNYSGEKYYPISFPLWARLIIHNQFYYATLYSLASYLIEKLEIKSNEIIQSLIPHEYVDGENHEKEEIGGFLCDIKIDAGGLERQLDELKHRWYQYSNERWLELSKKFVKSKPVVYMEDENKKHELNRNFIFNNEEALKRTRWKHFVNDCETIQGDFSVVAKLEKRELVSAEKWLRNEYKDIMKNFDPKVVRLKRKMKVVVMPGAFDGLGRDDE